MTAAPTKRDLTAAARRAERAHRRAPIEALIRALNADDVYAETVDALGFEPLGEADASSEQVA